MPDEQEIYKGVRKLGAPDLLELAVGDPEAIGTWPAVQELHARGDQPVYDAAIKMTQHANARHRAAGASILGQFDYRHRSYERECIDKLTSMLDDPEAEVVAAAAHGLGHRYGHDAVESLLRFIGRSESHVRYAVVHALNASEDARSTLGLITLSKDAESDVRDWATFGLAPLRRGSDSELVQALVDRLDDEDEEVRMEAIGGLALRKDPRAVDVLRKALADLSVAAGYLEAAEELADPLLYPLLQALESQINEDEEESYWSNCLHDACAACRPKSNKRSDIET